MLGSFTTMMPAYFPFVALIGAAWLWRRGGGGAAIESLETANRVLERQVHEQKLRIDEQDKTIAELRGRTDVSLALKPLLEWTSGHETRAQDRAEKMLNVLDLIAKRLGPDSNGH